MRRGRWGGFGLALRTRSLAGPGLALLLALGAATGAQAATDGDLDNSFSGDGGLVSDWNAGLGSSSTYDLALDSSGRLLMVGGDGGEIGVARFERDGTLDTGFAGDGDMTIHSGSHTGGERGVSVSIDPASGNILVLGQADTVSANDTVVARVLPDGTLDPTFDGPSGTGNGVVRFDFDANEFPGDILATGNDQAVFTVSLSTGATGVVRIAQLTATGTLDTTSFGNPLGYMQFQWAAGQHSFATGLAQQDDGKFVVAGFPNATATHGVARVLADGSGLDTSFNPGGAIPGIQRPPLPSGLIDSDVLDVALDPDGITVAGNVQAGSPSFDDRAMLSRLTFAGAPDASFGSSGGFAVLDVPGASSDGLMALTALGGAGYLALGQSGNTSPTVEYDQLFARFTSAGVLDTSFNSPGGYLVTNPGAFSVTGLALATDGLEAYGVGTASGSKFAITAVCQSVPPGCPGPETPDILAFDPASGGEGNNPRVQGSVPSGPAVTQVQVFANAACSGPPAGTGTEAEFNTTGIGVSVPDNTATTFHALAIGVNNPSPCSAGMTYTEVTLPTPPPQPPPPPQTKPKKKKSCKKKKGKPAAAAKKRKCKKKKKR